MKMNFNFISLRLIALALASGLTFSSNVQALNIGSLDAAPYSSRGILLLAHGGKPSWNEEVRKVAAAVSKTMPVEVAFGMASKRSIQSAIGRLEARGVDQIFAVPLFISSNSSVITSTEFLLGLREEAPADLAIFVRMDHGHGGDHGKGHDPDPIKPVNSRAKIKMLSALNAHPLVADILLSRARALSRVPEKEVVVIVAHGPVSDETNKLWLADMGRLASLIARSSNFRGVEYLTVRDDAPAPMRDAATTELRSVVSRASSEGCQVLIVPLLLSYGGIEEGIRKRLEGLDYSMSAQALLPDERLIEWILLSVGEAK